jgi:hypothetical protein
VEAKSLDQPAPEDGKQDPDPVSEEVAETTAHVHIEGKGLDPELERRYEND